MVRLTRLNGISMFLNSDLIEHIDITPDTVITLTTGQILRARETADEVVRRIVEFRRRILDLTYDQAGGAAAEPVEGGDASGDPA